VAFQVPGTLRAFAVFQFPELSPVLKNREANVLDFPASPVESGDTSSPQLRGAFYSFFISRTIVKPIFADYKC